MNGLLEREEFFIRSSLLRGDQYLDGYSTEDQRREPYLFSVKGESEKGAYNAFLNQIKIRDLKTGHYILQVEVLEVVKDKKIPVKTYKKKFFCS